MEQRPLAGVKVVELGTHVAVPTATRLMADWGADVIKVEGLSGDPWRVFGATMHAPVSADENPVFNLQNANKRTVALNLKSPEGLAILHKLLARADVFVSNVRLHSLEKMGLSYDALHEKYPGLVYYHFTGFGYEGEEAERPGFDIAAFWARTGALVDWADPDGRVINPSSGFGDNAVSAHILSGLLAALYYKEKTGVGIRTTSSLFSSGIWYNGSALATCQPRYGNRFPKYRTEATNPFLEAYRCKDGERMIIAALNYDAYREKMFRLMGLEAYLDDPRFANSKVLQEHLPEIFALMDEAFLTKDRAEWCAIFDAADIVYEKAVHFADVLNDKQAWANGYLTNVTWRNGAEAVMPQSPIRFFGSEAPGFRQTGAVGRDTRSVLEELGLSDAEITALAEKKAVGTAD